MMNFMSGKQPLARRGFFRAAGIALAIATMAIAGPGKALACGGSTIPPVCGKTTSISTSVPGVVAVDTSVGGSINLDLQIFNTSFVPGCSTPVSGTFQITFDCDSAPAASGPFVVNDALTLLLVPVAIPAGPPRMCNATVSTTIIWSDGMTTTATSKSAVCIVEELAGQPGVPRLDIELLTDAVRPVHPGDQVINTYRVTNNDPVEQVSLILRATSESTSRLPTMSGGVPGSGGGVFSISEPFSGDNFNIAFADQLGGLCVPLPTNPRAHQPPNIFKTVTLNSGDSMDVDVAIRPWGKCPSGSCGTQTVQATGFFADGSIAFGCASTIVRTDSSEPPQFLCGNAGRVLFPQPGTGAEITFAGQHANGSEAVIPIEIVALELASSVPIEFNLNRTTGNPETGAFRLQIFPSDSSNFAVDSFFDITYEIQFNGSPGTLGNNFLGVMAMPGPDSFGSSYFWTAGRLPVTVLDDDGSNHIDSFFDVFYQTSGHSFGPAGIHDLIISDVSAQVLPNGNLGIDFHGTLSPDAGTPTVVGVDFRMKGSLSGVPATAPKVDSDNDGFLDGFEVQMRSDPNDPGSIPIQLDFNGDGMVDLNDGITFFRFFTDGTAMLPDC